MILIIFFFEDSLIMLILEEDGREGWGGDAGLGEGARPREVAPHVEHPKVYVFVPFFRNCRGQMGT